MDRIYLAIDIKNTILFMVFNCCGARKRDPVTDKRQTNMATESRYRPRNHILDITRFLIPFIEIA